MTTPTGRTAVLEPTVLEPAVLPLPPALTRRESGRAVRVLGALAVLAAGVLAGLLLPGGLGLDDGTHGPAAGPGTAALGGVSLTAAAPAAGLPGTVTALAGDGFTMTGADGGTWTVTVSAGTTVTLRATGATSGALAPGDPVTVLGDRGDGTITATRVDVGDPAGGPRGGAVPPLP